MGLRLTLHYLGASEVDGGVIGRCIILGGLVLRFGAWSAESAGSGIGRREGSGALNNFGPAILEGLEELRAHPRSAYAEARVHVRT
jgi:hypothetical protein